MLRATIHMQINFAQWGLIENVTASYHIWGGGILCSCQKQNTKALKWVMKLLLRLLCNSLPFFFHFLQGTLECLEEEMLSFFSVSPESVYTTMMENGYWFYRLLISLSFTFLVAFNEQIRKKVKNKSVFVSVCLVIIILSGYLWY